MSDAEIIIEEWKQQIEALRPLVERARRRGERVKVNLYASIEVASPQFVALPHRQRVLEYSQIE